MAAEDELALASRTDRCPNCEEVVGATVVIRQLGEIRLPAALE